MVRVNHANLCSVEYIWGKPFAYIERNLYLWREMEKQTIEMKWFIGLICMFCGLSLQAQDLKSLYIALPDSLSPLLTKVNREDFGDFLANDMKAEVRNRFGKTSEMKKLTADYLEVRVSESSREEMKLLPLNDSVKVVCVVRTYWGPVADSEVRFYDTDWHELPVARFIDLPVEDCFYKRPFTETAADSLRNLRLHADMYLKEVRLSEEEQSLSVTYTTPGYMDQEMAEKLKPYLIGKPILYVWSDGKFKGKRETEVKTMP